MRYITSGIVHAADAARRAERQRNEKQREAVRSPTASARRAAQTTRRPQRRASTSCSHVLRMCRRMVRTKHPLTAASKTQLNRSAAHNRRDPLVTQTRRRRRTHAGHTHNNRHAKWRAPKRPHTPAARVEAHSRAQQNHASRHVPRAAPCSFRDETRHTAARHRTARRVPRRGSWWPATPRTSDCPENHSSFFRALASSWARRLRVRSLLFNTLWGAPLRRFRGS